MFHKRSIEDRTFDIINTSIMIIIMFLTVYPFWYIIVGSFNEGVNFLRGGIYFWPRAWTLSNYAVVFQDKGILRAFSVTIGRTVIGLSGHLLVTSLFAYAYSRKNLMGKKLYGTVAIITMFFSGGLIPYYLLITWLGLINSFLVYIIPGLFSFYNAIIFMSFFRELPDAIFESAKMDGASEYRIYFNLVVPLSKPVFAALGLFVAVGHWNAFFDSMMFTSKNELQTIQLFLMKIIRTKEAAAGIAQKYASMSPAYAQVNSIAIQMAAMVIVSLPIMLVYPFLQKHFTQGMMIGSIKG
jgi:putative aldouronate transport system permease protein